MKLRFVSTAVLLFAMSVAIYAQSEDLPSGATLIDKYLEATGGKEAHESVKTQVTKGRFEIPAAGIKADMTIYAAAPDKMATLAENEMIGKIASGCANGVAWENTTMTGARIKEGKEKADTFREAAFDKMTNWPKYYSSIETVGQDSVDGQLCYKVIMTPKEGTPQTAYMNAKTYLIQRLDVTADTPMGLIPVETYLSDYRDIGGLLTPCKLRVQVMGQDRVITMDSIQYNVEIPDSVFALPDEVQALASQE